MFRLNIFPLALQIAFPGVNAWINNGYANIMYSKHVWVIIRNCPHSCFGVVGVGEEFTVGALLGEDFMFEHNKSCLVHVFKLCVIFN